MLGARAGFSVALYCLTICGLFGVSALYHRRGWSPRGWKIMKRLDHSMIFLFIAGTYTPFALLAVDQPTGYWILAVVWAGRARRRRRSSSPGRRRPAGSACRSTSALGWVAVFVLTDILHIAGVTSMVLLAVGGAALHGRRRRLRHPGSPTPGPAPSATTRSSTR